MLILSLETSCDDTSAAVIRMKNQKLDVLANCISSQTDIHAVWGGVVPNLAARQHLANFLPVLDMALARAKVKIADIDLIAVTCGPGLIPCLLIGTTAARTLAYYFKKPLLGINHIEGHIYANFINEIGVNSKSQIPNFKNNSKFKIKNSKFPILCLVVSGGHTQLILMKKHFDYKIIGETLDDAAGEAFDKVARILGLSYPGGPAIAKLALRWKSLIQKTKSQANSKSQISNLKNNNYKLKTKNYQLNLPRPMIKSGDFNFSFSGLKTAVLYLVKKNPQILRDKKLISKACFEFQQAVIDVLVAKTLKAADKYRPKTILLAGGVSANLELRQQLGQAIKKQLKNTKYQIPDTQYSVDNAAMIGTAAAFRWKKMDASRKAKAADNWKNLKTQANLEIS